MSSSQSLPNNSTLQEQSLLELELNKVLDLVAESALTERAATSIRALRPALDAETIDTQLSAIEEIRNLRLEGEDLPLDRTDDPEPLLKRSMIAGAILSANQLLMILEILTVSRSIRHFLFQRAEKLPCLASKAAQLVEYRLLERHIRDALDPTGTVRDDASPELRRIRQSIAEFSSRLRSKLRRIVLRLGGEELLQDEFYTQRDGRFVIPLKVEYKRVLSGIIHGVSQTGATVFFEPSEVFELNNELAELRAAEDREVRRILQTLTAEVGSYAESILAADETLTQMDSLRARAIFAERFHGCRPRIVADGTIELRNVRHPLLVVNKGRDHVVPLTVSFDMERSGYLISGPNAGGKSIAIKVIGLSVAMALAGIYPLGNVTTTPVVVLVAIGDHQSIESNLSTFSSQLVRLRDILYQCTSRTLVVVDEICSGTDPSEGSALAAAIIDAVLDRGGYIVATTHQFTLKTYALSRPRLLNASMEFDSTCLQPTYRFLAGIPGNSYAFELARALHLPTTILERAQQYLGEHHTQVEKSISSLQKLHQEIEKRLATAAHHELHAEQVRKNYEARFEQFKAKYNQLIEAAKREAQELVRTTREQLRQIQHRAQSQSPQSVRSELQALENTLATQAEQKADIMDQTTLSIGDWVEIIGTQQKGRVLDITPKRVTIEVGSMRMQVPHDKLRRTLPPEQPRRAFRSIVKLDAPTSVDLRGLHIDDALRTLERALNDAVMGGVMQLTVIHGTGSGQLRNAIHSYLDEHPLVQSFQLGSTNEMNWGVTIVQLR